MTYLSLYQEGIPKRDSRDAAKEISRGIAALQGQIARIERETDATIAMVGSSTTVTAHGMMGVARISQLQEQLEMQAPGASGRLSMLADDHLYGMAEISLDHRRRMRRL